MFRVTWYGLGCFGKSRETSRILRARWGLYGIFPPKDLGAIPVISESSTTPSTGWEKGEEGYIHSEGYRTCSILCLNHLPCLNQEAFGQFSRHYFAPLIFQTDPVGRWGLYIISSGWGRHLSGRLGSRLSCIVCGSDSRIGFSAGLCRPWSFAFWLIAYRFI